MHSRQRIPAMTPAQVPEGAYILDVREDDEWRAGHPPGAHHLPMMQVPGRLDEVPRDVEIVVACRVGARSAQVVAYLLGTGLDRVSNLDGGLVAWAAAGRPLVSEDGHAPRVA